MVIKLIYALWNKLYKIEKKKLVQFLHLVYEGLVA